MSMKPFTAQLPSAQLIAGAKSVTASRNNRINLSFVIISFFRLDDKATKN